MTVRELYEILNEKIPSSLSCPWDNDGLMCCPDGTREVRRVLITLDVTEAAVDYAVRGGYDLILSHHPLIFKGLRAVNEEQYLARKTIRLIREGISVMSFHTRLDAVEGGVNDTLAALFSLRDVTPFGEEAIGRIGTLPSPISAREFAKRVKTLLHAPVVFLGDAGRPVSRVALLGGSGSDDLSAAKAAGADTYLSGNLGYHDMTDAPEAGMNLLEAGHYFTEQPVTETLKRMLLAILPDAEADIYESNTVLTI